MIVVFFVFLACVSSVLGLFYPSQEKKAPENDDAKKDDGVVSVILKTELHCEGCAKKVKDAVKGYKGVQSVKTDCNANKVTVVGEVDPVELKERLQKETKKKVELISTQTKKDAATGGGDKKPEKKKPPKERTDVLKIRLHPDDCIWEIMEIIRKFDGVDEVTVKPPKNLVTVKGTVDIKKRVRDLEHKLKGDVEIVPAKGGGKKNDKKPADKAEKRRTKQLLLQGLLRVVPAVLLVVAHFL